MYNDDREAWKRENKIGQLEPESLKKIQSCCDALNSWAIRELDSFRDRFQSFALNSWSWSILADKHLLDFFDDSD